MPSDADEVESYRLLIADVYELAGLSRRVSEREASSEGSTVARWHVLSVVSTENVSVPDIARRLGQVRQGVQRVVDELVVEGLLERKQNPTHRRSPLFMATDSGHALLKSLWIASEHRRRDALAVAELNGKDLDVARHVVQRLTKALRQIDQIKRNAR